MNLSILYESSKVYKIEEKPTRILGNLISELTPKTFECSRNRFSFEFDNYEILGKVIGQFEIPKKISYFSGFNPVIIGTQIFIRRTDLEIDWTIRKLIEVNRILQKTSYNFNIVYVQVALAKTEPEEIWKQYNNNFYQQELFEDFIRDRLKIITQNIEFCYI